MQAVRRAFEPRPAVSKERPGLGEQRNWQSVRRHVGYERYSSKAAYELLLKLYPLLCLQMNFFRPVRKLVSKERQGARVTKRYDAPMTPFQRLLAGASSARRPKPGSGSS